jgi:hypothetical protein
MIGGGIFIMVYIFALFFAAKNGNKNDEDIQD